MAPGEKHTKLGIIGFSTYLQRSYIPYLKQRSDIELSAICNGWQPKISLHEAINKLSLTPRPPLFGNWQEMLDKLNSDTLDAVIISTPHRHHFEQVQACLEKGWHVMVDKPLACRLDEARTLVDLAEAQDLKLAVANQRRYEHPYQYIKQALREERLGELRLVAYLFAHATGRSSQMGWRADPKLSGGGALIDTGHHVADMVTWLLDRPLLSVYAAASFPDNSQVERSVTVLATFKPNILVNIVVSYESPAPSLQEEMKIYGSQGAIFTRRFHSERSNEPPLLIEQSRNGEVRRLSFTEGPVNWNPLANFLQGVQEGEPILSDGKSNLLTIELIDAAYLSIRKEQRIDM